MQNELQLLNTPRSDRTGCCVRIIPLIFIFPIALEALQQAFILPAPSGKLILMRICKTGGNAESTLNTGSYFYKIVQI